MSLDTNKSQKQSRSSIQVNSDANITEFKEHKIKQEIWWKIMLFCNIKHALIKRSQQDMN